MPSNSEGNKTNIDNIMSSPCQPISIQFIDLSYRIKLNHTQTHNPAHSDRTILNKITGQANPGELLAVLGPSGSGKSTLLTILAGRSPARYTGSVLANSSPVTKSVLKRVGFVTQDDILYPHLTVRETLVYCAMLRLPKTVSKHEKTRAAESVIGELGLEKCTETQIGNAFVKGVSGGERKRVAIAHEMLVNPSLLILDEPTSGLDSTAAGRLVSTLGGMARKGRTIITSVHQPSSRVYQMFDSVMLLSEGNCVYFGKGKDTMDYFRDVGFVPRFHVNPADFMLDLANGFIQTEYSSEAEKSGVKQALVSSYNRVLAPTVKASVTASVAASGDALTSDNKRSDHKEKKDNSISWFTQFSILLQRSLKERKHETFNSLRIFQVIAASLLAGSMWWHSNIHNVQDRLGLLFFISIFWGVFASFNATFTFPQERAIFIKERASGMYTLSSYYMARMAGDLPMELILPTIFTFIVYWMAGLRPAITEFLLMLAVLLGYVLVAQGLGLVIGAAIMDAKQASTLVTVTMLAFLLTGGFYVQHVPSCMTWMKYASFTFYCYRLLIGVQYSGYQVNGQEIVKQVGVYESVGALILMFVGYRILAYVALRRIKV